MTLQKRPLGVTALSLLFVFGAIMSGVATAMLLFPGGVLDPAWRVNPHAHQGFTTMGPWALLLVAAVFLGCIVAAFGLWRCTRLGLWTALAILCVNLVGDAANVVIARDWHALIGVPIAGFMVAYLLGQRHVFDR
jgi:hypothetical protein